MDGFEWSRECTDFVSLTTYMLWYFLNRGAACFTSYQLCDVSEATAFKGKQKASVPVLLPHGLTPYGPASLPQVGTLLVVPQSAPDSKSDPALAISAPRCWNDPPGTETTLFLPPACLLLLLLLLALVTWHQSCTTPCNTPIESIFSRSSNLTVIDKERFINHIYVPWPLNYLTVVA